MNKLIMSTEKYEICRAVQELGFDIISSEKINDILSFESRHADMQCLRINDTVFVLNRCKRLLDELSKSGLTVIKTESDIKREYPENVILNAVYFHNKLFCREKSLDKTVKDFCKVHEIKIINVNQGYTNCSTAIVNECFITADRGIFYAMKESGEEGILIDSGCIDLDGVNCGFIGGCCFEDDKNVFFTGDIKFHPDYNKIKAVCGNKNIICLTGKKLYDIGGFVAF